MLKLFWHPWSSLFLCVVTAAGAFFTPSPGKASAWTVRNPSLLGPQLNGVAFGAGRVVAVGQAGHVLTSTDLSTWLPQNHGADRRYTTVIFAAGKFVAIGTINDFWTGTHGLIAISEDGLSWTEHRGPVLNAITYANGQFVGVGNYSIATSSDAINWTRHTPPVHVAFGGVAYGNGVYVTMGRWRDDHGDDGALEYFSVQRSADGVTWTERPAPIRSLMTGIAFGHGLFVMVAESGGVFTSPDGQEWTARNAHAGAPLKSVSFADGMFLAVGNNGAIVYSTDGINWSRAIQSVPSAFFGCTRAFGSSVAVGEASSIVTSADNISWNSPGSVAHCDLRGIASSGNRFVAVGTHGGGAASEDGRLWFAAPVNQPFGPSYTWFNAVAYGNNVFAAVGGLGAPFFTSTNGTAWTGYHSNIGIDNHLDVAYGSGRFVSVGLLSNGGYGARGGVRISTNGVDWFGVPTSSTNGLRSVAFGEGLWIAGGDNRLATSPDGLTWTEITPPQWGSLDAAAYGAGRFVLAGTVSGLLTSTDGVHWSHLPAFEWMDHGVPRPDEIRDIAFGANQFVAVGRRPMTGEGVIWSSPDGISWTHSATFLRPLNAVAFNGSTFAAVGDGGLIVQSDQQATTAAVSRLAIRTVAPGVVEIACRTQAGRQYHLQSSADGRDWQNIVTFQSAGAETTHRQNVSGGMRLYRLVSP